MAEEASGGRRLQRGYDRQHSVLQDAVSGSEVRRLHLRRDAAGFQVDGAPRTAVEGGRQDYPVRVRGGDRLRSRRRGFREGRPVVRGPLRRDAGSSP
ncbi:unnamed protein product, partial [Ectocarpus sp. 12 AP-2014]